MTYWLYEKGGGSYSSYKRGGVHIEIGICIFIYIFYILVIFRIYVYSAYSACLTYSAYCSYYILHILNLISIITSIQLTGYELSSDDDELPQENDDPADNDTMPQTGPPIDEVAYFTY